MAATDRAARMGRRSGLLLGLALFGWVGSAAAQDGGNVIAGRQLAEMWCSSCHLESPDRSRGVSNGIPTFAAVAHMQSTTAASLQSFLQVPHVRMPDLQLSRDERDDLVAYILSLRGE